VERLKLKNPKDILLLLDWLKRKRVLNLLRNNVLPTKDVTGVKEGSDSIEEKDTE
jgi:hypothetical protein